jgi:hypothetical protein
MTGSKERKPGQPPRLDAPEPSSAPRPKAVGEDLGLLIASLKARTVGADAAELEAEIERFYKKAIDLSAASLPEHLRPKLREMVEEHLRDDPTLLAMTEDLRRGLRRG